MPLIKIGQKISQIFGDQTPMDYLALKEQTISKTFLEKSHMQELLPYCLYSEERGLYETDGALGFTIEINPMSMVSSQTQEELTQLIRSLYLQGASVQFLLFADPFIDPIFDNWQKARVKQKPVFSKIAHKKKEFFQSENHLANAQHPVPLRNFRCFMSFSSPKKEAHDISSLIRELIDRKKQAITTLSRVSDSIDVKPFHLIEILTSLLSVDQAATTSSPKEYNPYKFIKEQVEASGGIQVTPRGLMFEGREKTYFKMFQACDLPEEWCLPLNAELLGDFLDASYRLSSPFFIHYGIHYCHQRKEELNLRSKNVLLRQQFKISDLFRKNPHVLRESQEHDLVFQETAQGEKFVRTRLNVGLYSSLDKFGESESTLLALYQKLGFKMQETHFFHLDDLIKSLPMGWGEVERLDDIRKTRKTKTTLSKETSSFVPLVGEWKGNSREGMMLVGRRGQIAFWDPFVSESNYNGVVVGASGSGKTVFMAELMTNQMAVGGRVFVLDLGRSFEKLCHLLDGQYLFFTPESRLNLNPFSLIRTDGDTETLDTALNMVSSIVATMAMPMEKIDGDRANILNRCVREAWRLKNKEARIDDIITILQKTQYSSELMRGASESLIDRLERFSSRGEYRNFFYGEEQVNFKSDFVVIETEELKNMGDLQAVILQIFSLMISTEVFLGDREKRSLICIDEAWDLLKSPQMEGFIESMARRLRKYNGSLFVGTQSLKDFESSAGAAAAFKNSNWLVMLGRDSDSVNTIREKKIFDLSESTELMLNSLRKGKGYSEALIHDKASGGFCLSQLRLDPFSLLLFSTKPDEFGPIIELKKLGFSVEQAIEWMIEKRKQLTSLMDEGKPIKEALRALIEAKCEV